MKFALLLNRNSSTLKGIDIDEFERLIKSCFSDASYEVIEVGSGKTLDEKLDWIVQSDCDGAIVCGGDGTVSAAAGHFAQTDKILGVLPTGTFNLYARTLNVPLDLKHAVAALAKADIKYADICKANGRIFTHQFATGLQTRTVKLRNKMAYGSKFSKMFASARAVISVVARPPKYKLEMSVDDGGFKPVQSSIFAVTNNVFGVGHLPYADRIDEGVMGLYFAEPLDRMGAIKIILDSALGRLPANEYVTTERAKKVTLRFPKVKKSDQAVIDGELIDLQPEVTIEILPKALRVLIPHNGS